MQLLCLKCGARVSDDHVDPCPGNGAACGAREWVVVDEPKKLYPWTATDRRFLKSLRITQVQED